MKKKYDILNGDPFKALLAILWPLLVCGLFQQLYTMVDGIIIGHYLGSRAHAIVGGSPSNLIGIFNNLNNGMVAGTLVVIAQATGAGDQKRQMDTIKNGITVIITLGIFIMGIYYFFAESILMLLSHPQELMDDSVAYMRLYILGFIPYGITMLLINLQRGMGETRRPTYMLVFSYVLYTLFDILYIIVLKKGMAGVPMSYFSTYLVNAIYLLWVTNKDYHLLKNSKLIDNNTVKTIIKNGVPAAITSMFYALSSAVLTLGLNRLGGDIVASYSVSNKLTNIFWIIMSALATATLTMIATNYGAKRYERLKPIIKSSLALGFISVTAIFLMSVFARYPLLSLFTKDEKILMLSAQITRFFGITYYLYPVLEVYTAALKGIGHAVETTWITLICVCFVRFIIVLGLGHLITNPFEVLSAFPIAWFLTSVASFVTYQIVKKKTLNKTDLI